MIQIFKNVDVASVTTFGLHARAAALVQYDTVDDLLQALRDPSLPRPFKHIGAGSNLLFSDNFSGTLLHSAARRAQIFPEKNGEVLVSASAGFVMDKLCYATASRGIWGLENLSGIPGEVGASVVQNVGAYGTEVADVLKMVKTIDTATLEPTEFSVHHLEYGYRDSFFKHSKNRDRYIVTEVLFNLSKVPSSNLGYANLAQLVAERHSDPETLSPMTVREVVIEMRNQKLPDPAEVGSAGSFFKNPVVNEQVFRAIVEANPSLSVPHYQQGDGMVKIPAAWLIDQCGLKGAQIGGAAVWSRQPLVICNPEGNATPADVVALRDKIIDTVNSRFGIRLSPEVEEIH